MSATILLESPTIPVKNSIKGGGWTIAASERADSIVGAPPSLSDKVLGCCIFALGEFSLQLGIHRIYMHTTSGSYRLMILKL